PTEAETIAAILVQHPERLVRYAVSASESLQQIVQKCLEKDRERRYQDTGELRVDLLALKHANASGPATQTAARSTSGVGERRKVKNSLAVLPLVNGSNDAGMEYLSDGVTESIINNLSQLPSLRVMARNAVFRFKGQEIEAQRVGHLLDVRAVLAGRV